MPITNLFLTKPVDNTGFDALVKAWAELTVMDEKYFTGNAMQLTWQAVVCFAVMAHLYLPTLWDSKDRQRIGLAPLNALKYWLGAGASEVFILTFPVASGSEVENGEVQHRDKTKP